jgi:hypothetical protein
MGAAGNFIGNSSHIDKFKKSATTVAFSFLSCFRNIDYRVKL